MAGVATFAASNPEVAEVEVVKAGVATFAASNPEVAEVEVVKAGVATFAASNPEVAEVEVVRAGVATFAASNPEVADMELVDVGLVKATDGAEITGTAASSSHPVPPVLVTSPILYSNNSNLALAWFHAALINAAGNSNVARAPGVKFPVGTETMSVIAVSFL